MEWRSTGRSSSFSSVFSERVETRVLLCLAECLVLSSNVAFKASTSIQWSNSLIFLPSSRWCRP